MRALFTLSTMAASAALAFAAPAAPKDFRSIDCGSKSLGIGGWPGIDLDAGPDEVAADVTFTHPDGSEEWHVAVPRVRHDHGKTTIYAVRTSAVAVVESGFRDPTRAFQDVRGTTLSAKWVKGKLRAFSAKFMLKDRGGARYVIRVKMKDVLTTNVST